MHLDLNIKKQIDGYVIIHTAHNAISHGVKEWQGVMCWSVSVPLG